MRAKLLLIILADTYIVADHCVNGSIRLTGESRRNEGVVEICLDNVWGTITSESWDSSDTEVVCRQLGFPWDCKCNSETDHTVIDT